MKPRSMIRGLGPIVISLTVLSACGSSTGASSNVPSLNGSAASSKSATTTTLDPEKAAQEFVKCAKTEGVTLADPKVDSNGRIDFRSMLESSNLQPGSDAFRSLMTKCGSKLQSGGFGPNAVDQKERRAALLAFTACLRKQGLTVSDLPTGGPGFGPGGRGNDGGNNAGGNTSTTAAGTSGSGVTTTTAAGSGNGGGGGGFGGGGGQGPPRTDAERTARMAERLGLDLNDPAVSVAFKSCNKELTTVNSFRGGRNGTTTTTTAAG